MSNNKKMLADTPSIKFVDSMDLVVSACIAAANATGQCESLSTEPADLQQDLDSVDLVFSFSAQERFNSVAFSATASPGAVARTSWLNYVSLWFNQEAQAAPIAKSIADEYECVAKAASGNSNKPVVAWADYAPPADFNDNAATWSVVSPSYKSAYTKDSGATILANKSFTNNADFVKYISSVDILIDESFLGTETMAGFLKAYELPETSDLKFVKNKQVYRTDKVQNALGWTGTYLGLVY
jgi:ABC-type Fe3+-hydroxamate transport system substrate-binding protein